MTDAKAAKPSSTTPMEGSASTSDADTDTNADEAMRLAIARFRSRMAAANQTFLRDRVNEIEAKGLATEEEKRRQLSMYRWMGGLKWADEVPKAYTRHDGNLILPQTRVKDLDIPAVFSALPSYAPADGVLPPRLRTEQWLQMYLDTVHDVCQRQADALVDEDEPDATCYRHQDHRPMTIPRSDELALFLKYAQEVVDVDFRHSGIAPFAPAWPTGIRDEELEELNEEQRRDKLVDPELLMREQESLQQHLEDERFNGPLDGGIDDDLDVRAGFITGVGYNERYACESWYSAYVYCRRWVDNDVGDGKRKDGDVQDAANIEDWGWRVVFFRAEVSNPSVLHGRRARFDSIPEFLDWYASWLDHLDARGLLSLRRHAKGCETDCESDCEYH